MHLLQDFRSAIPGAERLLQRRGNVDRDIDADLVDQPQRAHRHSPFEQRAIDLFHAHTVLKHFRRVQKIREQDPVHEEARRILDKNWQLPDLPGEGERALADFLRGLRPGHHFDQLHPADRIEEMKADDARGRAGADGQFINRQRGGVRGEDRAVGGIHRQVPENFLFDLELFRGGLDHDLHVAQRHWLRRSDNARPAFLCLGLVHQAALHRVGVSLVDVREAAIDRRRIDVAQDNRNAARAKPLRDPRAHDAGADHGRVHDFLGRSLRRAFAIFIGEEEISNQVLGRIRRAQLADGVHFHRERFFHRGTDGALNDFVGACGSGVASHLWRGELRRARRRWSSALQFSLARCKLPARRVEQLFARNYFIDETELQRLRRAIKFAFQDHLGRRVGADQSRQARRSAPGGNETERRFRQPDLRRRIIGRDSVIAGQRDLVAATRAGAVDRSDGRHF